MRIFLRLAVCADRHCPVHPRMIAIFPGEMGDGLDGASVLRVFGSGEDGDALIGLEMSALVGGRKALHQKVPGEDAYGHGTGQSVVLLVDRVGAQHSM